MKPSFMSGTTEKALTPNTTRGSLVFFDKLDQDTEGTGVGLAIVKRIVEGTWGSYLGGIRRESEKGALFALRFQAKGSRKSRRCS